MEQREENKILDTSVTLNSGDIISLGFNRVAHETAATINDVTKKHFLELADMHTLSSEAPNPEVHKEEYVARSLQKLAFTMSDRASNEKLATKLLNDWRDETLQNFEGDVKTVHSFHCMARLTWFSQLSGARLEGEGRENSGDRWPFRPGQTPSFQDLEQKAVSC